MSAPVLSLKDIRLTFGGGDLFNGVTLSVRARDRFALVGRNGCGKSTLLKVIAGHLDADGGERVTQTGLRIACLAQEPDFSAYDTVLAFVLAELGAHESDYAHQADILLDAVKIDKNADPNQLSGGEGRRAALARLLVAAPDVMLLDEPTNHLDLPTIRWLEDHLNAYRGALVVISHDRRFLENICNATLWLDRGVVRRSDRGFAHFDDWSQTVLEQEAGERARLDKLIAEETRWSHAGITARRKRNMGRMRRLEALRKTRAGQIARIGRARLAVESGDTSGKVVIEAEDISKSCGGRPILTGFSTRILRGDRIGVIGPNGAGKSTLLKLLTRELEPDRGIVKHGSNLTPTYFDQKRTALDGEKSLWDTLADLGGDQIMVRGTPRHVVTYLREFLFDEAQARTPVKALSGGERNRLLLAKKLARPTNLLILDEPTNDLDMETLDLLQEVLADYDGTLLLVSHDRDFLDRVVTSTIVLKGDGSAEEYPGGYGDYERRSGGGFASVPAQGAKGKKAGTTAVTKPLAKPKKKLSYKQQRDLKLLPGQIEALGEEIAALQSALADGALYRKDAVAFQTKTARLSDACEALETLEERWLELEILREEI